jgi:diguanylate cyclase (GGDEF)-like protein
VCARVGGDEFAVAMPETSIERARDVAARLRTAIRQVGLSAKSADQVAVSIGVAEWRPGQDWQAVYQVGDGDLYEDKRRHKAARRWVEPERERPAIRLLGRGGRRKVAGA